MLVVYACFYVAFFMSFCDHLHAAGQAALPDSGNYRSRLAIRIEHHQLIANVLLKKSVQSEFDCLLECVNTKECLSFDMSGQEGPLDLWFCYLLSSDHYRHRDRLVPAKGYDHFYFENACSSFSCGPSETCIPVYESNNYTCMCNVKNRLVDCGRQDNTASGGISHWRITTSDTSQGIHNYNWTTKYVFSGVSNAYTSVELQNQAGSEFILHTPGLDLSAGNISFELAGQPNHYVIADNDLLKVQVFEDTEEFKRKATFSRYASSSHPGYEIFMSQDSVVFYNIYSGSGLRYKNKSVILPGDIYWFKIVN